MAKLKRLISLPLSSQPKTAPDTLIAAPLQKAADRLFASASFKPSALLFIVSARL